MEKEKKGLLKGLISKVTGAAKKVPGVLKSVSDKVGSVLAAPGLAVSKKISEMVEPARFDRSTYKAPGGSSFKKAYPNATKTGESKGVEVYSNLVKKVKSKTK